MFWYNIGIKMYAAGIKVAALIGNPKAKQWIQGRKESPTNKLTKPCIWIHAASLGEFEQARPLLEALHKKYPNYSGFNENENDNEKYVFVNENNESGKKKNY